MKSKNEVVSLIKQSGIVAIIRTDDSKKAFKIAQACIEGGLLAVEITFTVPGAKDIIKDLVKKYSSNKIIIGAGTVNDAETARTAILEGAQFIVSPYLDEGCVKLCNSYGIACIPGAMTPKEVAECLKSGVDLVKLFPAEALSPKIVKAIRAPLPQAELMPTGGINLDNVEEWLKAGASVVGLGGNLTAGAKTGDYESITAMAGKFIKKIRKARESM